jgi:hypothetical protein
MADPDNLVLEQLKRIHDEQRAIRNEMRRVVDTQMTAARSLENMRNSIGGLRDDLELMIRTEIGGLFAHLETRLEQRLAEARHG